MNYEQFYKCKKWKQIRAQALRRDGYMCTLCKRYGKIKEAYIVHHLTPIDKAPSEALNINNLISLCFNCHNKVHNRNNFQDLSTYGKEIETTFKRKLRR